MGALHGMKWASWAGRVAPEDTIGVRNSADFWIIKNMCDAPCRVDPFSPDSPIKSLGISHFPPDVFFVLRVMQLLRGLAGGLGVDFSAARQWAPLARRALRRAGRNPA